MLLKPTGANGVLRTVTNPLTANPAGDQKYSFKRVKRIDPGEYIYFADFVVSLGARVNRPGADIRVNRVWANDILIYDREEGYTKPGNAFTFYPGSENQGEVYRGMHYRGLMVLKFIDFNLSDYGSTIPAITTELLDSGGIGTQTYATGFLTTSLSGEALSAHLSADRDSLYRATLLDGQLQITRVRLSTKKQVKHVVAVTEVFSEVVDPATISVVFAPELSRAITCCPVDDHYEILNFDTETGASYANLGVFASYATEFMRATIGPYQLDYVIMVGGTGFEDYVYLVQIKNDTLSEPFAPISFMAEGDGDVHAVVVGNTYAPGNSQVVGRAEFYVATDTKVHRVFVDPTQTTLDYETAYSVPLGQRIVQMYYANATLYVIVQSNVGTTEGFIVALDANDNVLWTSGTFSTPLLSRGINLTSQEPSSNLSGGNLLLRKSDAEAGNKVTFVYLDNGDSVDLDWELEIPDTPIFWDSSNLTAYTLGIAYTTYGLSDTFADLSVADMMRSYAAYVGYADAEITTINLDNKGVDGYVVSDQSTLGSLSTQMGELYGFVWHARTGEVIFKNNYNGDVIEVDVTVDQSRLAVLSENGQEVLNFSRSTNNSKPYKISLTYFDGENDYKSGFQSVSNDIIVSYAEINMSLPITLSGEDARNLLQEIQDRSMSSLSHYRLRLPAEGQILDPGDIVEFTAYGQTYTGIIAEHYINGDNSVSLQLNEIQTDSYPANVPTQPSVVLSKTRLPVNIVMLDIPSTAPYQNRDNQLNLLVAVSAQIPGTFRGTTVQYKDPATNDWQVAAVFDATEESYIGEVAEPFDVWAYPFEEDTLNSLIIELGSIPVSYFSEPGEKILAIGSGSTAELIAFSNVEQIDATHYRLYNLLRGRYGTEVFITPRVTGEYVTVIKTAKLLEYPMEVYTGGLRYDYRTIDTNTPAFLTEQYSIAPEGNSRKPYAPFDVHLFREDGTGDILIKYKRRSRFFNSPPTNFYTDAMALDEAGENYVFGVYSAEGALLWRRYAIPESEGNIWYTQAEQTTDGLVGNETQLDLVLYQVSPELGSEVNDREFSGAGFGTRLVYPVYTLGTNLLSARFALAGSLDANVDLVPAGALGVTFALGGSLVADIADSGALSAAFALGGALQGNIREPVKLSAAFDGGGALVGHVGVGKFVGGDFALGGALVADIAPSTVLPNDYVDLLHWFDLADTGTLTLTGTAIDQIADKSGNNYHATASGAARPIYDATTIDGKTVAEFSAASLMSMAWENTIDALTCTIVFKSTQQTTSANWYTQPIVYGREVAGVVNDFGIIQYDGFYGLNVRAGGIAFGTLNRLNDGNPHVMTFVRTTTGAVRMYVDGVVDNTTTVSGNTLDAMTTINMGMNGWDGDLAEVFAYRVAMAEADILDLHNYAMTKWGIA